MPFKPVDQAIKIILGPCIDDTDFKTREETLTFNQAGMEIDVILEKHDGTVTTTAVTPTNAGDYDWVHTDQGYYELEIPASGGANYNNDTEGILHVVGFCTGVLPFRSPAYDVVPEKVYNSLVEGSDNLEVDQVQLGGSTQSATDLKNFADAGYDPATNKVQGVALTDTLTTYTGNTPQTGDSYAVVNHADHGNAKLVRSTTPANKLDVSVTGEAGLDFGNTTGTIDAAQLGADCITAAKIADAAIDNATFAADVGSTAYGTNIIALAVRKVFDELNLDHLCKTVVADNADMTAEVPDGTVLSNMLSKTSDTSTYVVADDSLQGISEGAAGGGLNAQETRDAMKLAPTAGAPAAGSVDEHLDNASTHDAAAVRTAIEANGSKLDVLYDDWLDGGRLDLILDDLAGGGSTYNITIEDREITVE